MRPTKPELTHGQGDIFRESRGFLQLQRLDLRQSRSHWFIRHQASYTDTTATPRSIEAKKTCCPERHHRRCSASLTWPTSSERLITTTISMRPAPRGRARAISASATPDQYLQRQNDQVVKPPSAALGWNRTHEEDVIRGGGGNDYLLGLAGDGASSMA